MLSIIHTHYKMIPLSSFAFPFFLKLCGAKGSLLLDVSSAALRCGSYLSWFHRHVNALQ